jgi:hypothetical protein
MIRGDKIPSRISDNRDIKLFEAVNHVCTEAVFVNQAVLVAGVVDAAVNASPHVSKNDEYSAIL